MSATWAHDAALFCTDTDNLPFAVRITSKIVVLIELVIDLLRIHDLCLQYVIRLFAS